MMVMGRTEGLVLSRAGTSGLKPGAAGLLGPRAELTQEPGHQLALPPLVGLPPGGKGHTL